MILFLVITAISIAIIIIMANSSLNNYGGSSGAAPANTDKSGKIAAAVLLITLASLAVAALVFISLLNSVGNMFNSCCDEIQKIGAIG